MDERKNDTEVAAPLHGGWRRWFREPLLHFAVMGLGIFLVNAALAPVVEDDQVIELTPERKKELSQRFADARGRPPTDEELGDLLDDWIVQEMLYREGLSLGMDRDDVVIRKQVVRKMAYFYRSLAEVETPSDQTLRRYLADNIDRYAQPARYDFVHVFVPKSNPDGEAEIQALQAQVSAGADPHKLGVRYPKGRRFRRRTHASLVETFDQAFADAVAGAKLDTWTLARSRHGWHTFRVSRRHEARPADFDRLREQLLGDYQREQEQVFARESVDELRAEYRVVEVDGE